MDQADAEPRPAIQLDTRTRNAVLGAVLLGLFLAALDQNVVGTALPRIVTDLGGNVYYTWVVTSYLLTSTVTVPIYGKLSDIYGRKLMLIIGIVLFLAGSWLSGISQNMAELIVFRGLQGLGGGALFPISLAIIGDLFTPRERGRYQGLFGAVFGLSFLIGPFIGGWLTDNASWHWVFYVNMPIGVAALAVIVLELPNFHPATPSSARDLDYLGIALFTAGVVPFLLGLTNKGMTNKSGHLHDWNDPSVWPLLLGGLVLLAVFLFVESRAKQPIIPLDLFRNRTYSASNVATFMLSFGMFASVIFLPRYFQSVRGISATKSGYMIWPLLVGLIGSSIGTGILISKLGRYKTILLASMCSFILGSFLLTHIQRDTPDWELWLWMFISGVGIGPSMSGFTVVIQNSVDMTRLGVATSTMTFLRQIGGTIGLAIAGTLFSQSFTHNLASKLLAQGVPAQIAARFAGAGSGRQDQLTGVGLAAQLRHSLPPQLQPLVPKIVRGVYDTFSLAIGNVFWLTVASGVLALIAVILLPNLRLRGRETAAGPQAADAVPGGDVPVKDHVAAP